MKNPNELVPKAPPKHREDIEKAAHETLVQAFHYPQNLYRAHALFDFFEQGGLTQLGFKYGVKQLVGAAGKYDALQNCVVLSEDTYEALFEDDPIARVTLAHEIGHGVLHKQFLRTYANSGTNHFQLFKRRDIPCWFDPEWQADRFAVCFLMPKSFVCRLIRSGASDTKLASRFMVTLNEVKIRRKSIFH